MGSRSARHLEQLWRIAQALARGGPPRHAGRPLPPLLFFTDPVRTPDPAAVAARLPVGTGVVFRHFGAPEAAATGAALAKLARRRGLVLLIGDDEVGSPGTELEFAL